MAKTEQAEIIITDELPPEVDGYDPNWKQALREAEAKGGDGDDDEQAGE